MKEFWRKINDFNDYSVSSKGRVRNDVTGYLFNPQIVKGYARVVLHKNKVTTRFLVHRLVASAFVNNDENKEFVNHKNGVRTDNCLLNLEWVTASENTLHRYQVLKHSLSDEARQKISKSLTGNKLSEETKMKISEANKGQKRSREQFVNHMQPVYCIELNKTFECIADASTELGLDRSAISKVCKGKLNQTGGLHFKYLKEVS